MNINRLDLNLVVALDALLTEQHVSRAAERIGLSQPSMSNALRKLRLLLGDQILVRSGNRMIPTPRALALAAPIRAVLETVEQQLLSPGFVDLNQLEEHFCIAASDGIQELIGPSLVKAVHLESPNSTVQFINMVGETAFEDMEKGHLSLTFGLKTHAHPRMKQMRLFDEGFTCVMNDRHPDVHDNLSLSQYIAADHLLVAPMGDHLTGVVESVLSGLGLKRRVRVASATFLTVPSLLADSALIATMPDWAARILATRANLKLLPPPVIIPDFTLYLYWHPRNDNDPAHCWLRQTLRAILSQETGAPLMDETMLKNDAACDKFELFV